MCRYSLLGLPAAHRCPECGFEYDEHTRVWRSGFGAPFHGAMGLIIAIGVINGVMQFTSRHNSWANKSVWLMFMAVYIAFPWFVWRSRPLIAVTPKGIFTRWMWKKHTAEWSRIDRAGDYEANVMFNNADYGFVEYARFLPNKAAQAEFRQAVTEGKRRYDPTAYPSTTELASTDPSDPQRKS